MDEFCPCGLKPVERTFGKKLKIELPKSDLKDSVVFGGKE